MPLQSYDFISLPVIARKFWRHFPQKTAQRTFKNSSLDTLPIQRSLSTYWCIESDTLGFRIELKEKPLSLRGIPSTVNLVYDPLGIVSPVTLVGKQILQDLRRVKVDWDDPVPEETLPRWERWRTELPLLEKFKMQPYYRSDNRVLPRKGCMRPSTRNNSQCCSSSRDLDRKRKVHCNQSNF